MKTYILEIIDEGSFIEYLPTRNSEKGGTVITSNAFKAQLFTEDDIDSISEWLTKEWLGVRNPIKVTQVMSLTF